jgi:hypothetical protein
MKKSLILALLGIFVFVVIVQSLHANTANPSSSKAIVLIEAMTIKVSSKTIAQLKLNDNLDSSPNVTLSLPALLYLIADPNAAQKVAYTKIQTPADETGKSKTPDQLKYLVRKSDGTLEQQLTDKPIGAILEATPAIDNQGRILLKYKYQYTSAIFSKQIDSVTSLPIGKPSEGSQTSNGTVILQPGVPAIVSGSNIGTERTYTLIRAEILNKQR